MYNVHILINTYIYTTIINVPNFYSMSPNVWLQYYNLNYYLHAQVTVMKVNKR